ncbi:formimidoylglutamate deiminase [Streptomyces sp. NBRC 109706]|uniref:formimidoylglutamate deiminase n=1 Tax=Streptomyces sp. NBRC 109706 TaxID=1550035 RepID=UPI0007862EB5|nr:formimidoylglutamate deiminase [Streptomyces sp. NBRC 109706]
MSLTAQTYWAEHATLGGVVEPGVVIATAVDGTITEVRPGVPTPPVGAVSLRGLTIPGLANVHSHAFHRALRGSAQVGAGTFWTWRNAMYELSSLLDPDGYHALARAVYAEMALAGITCVGEFHYLHHQPDGTPYGNPNAMGEALIAAAADAGIRITLLDTCYLAAGFGRPPSRPQRRFADRTADAWADRAGALRGTDTARIGAAIHSVRAVPAEALATVADWAAQRECPLHVHLSEQPRENEECQAAHGRTPTQLLADHGVLTRRTTAVHATHLEPGDLALLGGAGTGACLCPTTERDLADGIGPAGELRAAGCPLSLGSDSHAVIDILEEARALETGERLRSHVRGHFTADQLLRAATEQGHAALGWPEAGRLEVGALADFATVSLDTVRTSGPPPRLAVQAVIFAATAADVRHTVVGGRHIVRHGSHQLVHDTPRALRRAIAGVHANL